MVTFPDRANGQIIDATHINAIQDAVEAVDGAVATVASGLAGKSDVGHTHPAADVTGLTKASIGLGNVDNTSDAAKPVSTATQTALGGKANTAHTHTIANVTGLQGALDGKAATAHTHDDRYYTETESDARYAPIGSTGSGVTNLTTTRTATEVTVASDTGTDATIPAADATNAGVMSGAQAGKLAGIATGADVTAAAIGGGATDAAPVDADTLALSKGSGGGLRRLTWANLKARLGELFAALVHQHAAGDITSGVFVPERLGTGTRDGSKYLRDDGTWQAVAEAGGGGGSEVLIFDKSGTYATTNSGTNFVEIDSLGFTLPAGTWEVSVFTGASVQFSASGQQWEVSLLFDAVTQAGTGALVSSLSNQIRTSFVTRKIESVAGGIHMATVMFRRITTTGTVTARDLSIQIIAKKVG